MERKGVLLDFQSQISKNLSNKKSNLRNAFSIPC